jgi:hypothetical protein
LRPVLAAFLLGALVANALAYETPHRLTGLQGRDALSKVAERSQVRVAKSNVFDCSMSIQTSRSMY